MRASFTKCFVFASVFQASLEGGRVLARHAQRLDVGLLLATLLHTPALDLRLRSSSRVEAA
jgi:hypothetical protein